MVGQVNEILDMDIQLNTVFFKVSSKYVNGMLYLHTIS